MRRVVLVLFLLLAASAAPADAQIGGKAGIQTQNGGVPLGQAGTANCSGGAVTCTTSGGIFQISVPGGGGADVTQINTSSPITGGPVTSVGTIACPTCVFSGSALTNLMPVIGGAGQAVAVGTKSGNTTQFVTTTGAQTSNDCVKIDANGNHVAAGAACGAGAGNVTGSGLTNGQLVTGAGGSAVGVGNLSGDVTTAGGTATTLANSGVTAGSCGDTTHSCSVTVDVKGRITALSNNVIAGGGGGTGDFSSNTSTSVANEVVLFADTTGKLGKRSTGTGLSLLTSGVLSVGNLSGDLTTSGFVATLANSGVSAGSCGDTTHSCSVTVDAKGRVTVLSNNVIAGGGGGTLSASGTPTVNQLPKWASSTTLANSLLGDDGTTLTYTGTGGVTASSFQTGGASSGKLTLTNVGGAGFSFIETVGNPAANVNVTPPIALPASNGMPRLATTAGVESWADLTRLGTVTAGVWNGTTIALANGGTGQTTANGALNGFLPSQGGNSGKFLTTDGTNSSWAVGGGGGISGLTTNAIPKAASSSSIADSRMSDDGTTLTVTGSGLTVITATAGTAPSTPASGKSAIYVDGTSKKLCNKDDAGVVNCAGTGGGDFSSNTASSVDSEIVLFSGTAGKTGKRATGSGLALLASGVLSLVTAPSGAVVGTTDTQTLTNKSIVATQLTGTVAAAQMPALTGDVTTSAGAVATTIAANAVTAGKSAVVMQRRVCQIIVGADNGAALADADIGPQNDQCYVPYAATVVEVLVKADAGTPNVIVRKTSVATTNTALLSAALATAASGARACSNTGGTTGIDATTTCSATLQNTSIAAGETIGLASGTAGGTAKRLSVFVTYTVN